MSYFIPCRDCGCMESRNTGTILSRNPFAWCCSWQEAAPSKPVSIYEQLKQKDWAQSFYWFASSHATTWSMISRCSLQIAGGRWVLQWAMATAWQEPGPLRWSLVRGWLMQLLTWKQMKWCRGPWYGNPDSDAADGPSSYGVGRKSQRATRRLLLGSLLLEKNTEITLLSFPATQHAMSYYVPLTEDVTMDDRIASGAVVWVKLEKISCTKGLWLTWLWRAEGTTVVV